MSERGQWKTSVAYTAMFRVVDSSDNPVTGLVNTDFSKLLYKDGATSAQTVTITEIGNGQYKAVFTPNTSGYWVLLITNATYNTAGWQDDIQVYDTGTTDPDNIASVILLKKNADVEGSISDYKCLAGVIAVETQKKVITGATLSVKKTNGTTELFNATLTTDASQQPITQIAPN